MGISDAEAKDITAGMRGDSFKRLGGQGNNYNDMLRVYVEKFPFVELYSTQKLDIDDDLYTLEESPEIYEL